VAESSSGSSSSSSSWPWQVSLQAGGRHYCSGVLIHHSWVLTARDCRVRYSWFPYCCDPPLLGPHWTEVQSRVLLVLEGCGSSWF